MTPVRRVKWVVNTACCVLCLAPCTVYAQSVWMEFDKTHSMSVEIERPQGPRSDQTFWTAFISTQIRVAPKTSLVVELPVQNPFGSGAVARLIGNAYVGIRTHSTGPGFFEMGLRAPLASDRIGSIIGVISNPIDRRFALAGSNWSLSGSYNNFVRRDNGLVTRIRAGVQATTAPSGSGRDGELLGKYSAQLGFDRAGVFVLGGISGGGIINESSESFSDRTLHQIGIQASYGKGRVRPGIQLRVPLDRATQSVDYVFGINVSVALDSQN